MRNACICSDDAEQESSEASWRVRPCAAFLHREMFCCWIFGHRRGFTVCLMLGMAPKTFSNFFCTACSHLAPTPGTMSPTPNVPPLKSLAPMLSAASRLNLEDGRGGNGQVSLGQRQRRLVMSGRGNDVLRRKRLRLGGSPHDDAEIRRPSPQLVCPCRVRVQH